MDKECDERLEKNNIRLGKTFPTDVYRYDDCELNIIVRIIYFFRAFGTHCNTPSRKLGMYDSRHEEKVQRTMK
jgi:hypothetical protein